MERPKVIVEWKFNPASLLAIIVAAVSIIAGFSQARADIAESKQKVDRLTEIEYLDAQNRAKTMQILEDHERRLTRLEDK